MPVITGAAVYPTDVLEKVKESGVFVDEMNALDLAESAGSAKAVNIVLMGRLARYLGIGREKWVKAIEETVPAKTKEMNLKAFELGYNYEM